MAEKLKMWLRASALNGYSECVRKAWIDGNRDLLDAAKLRNNPKSIQTYMGSCVHDVIHMDGDAEEVVDKWWETNITEKGVEWQESRSANSDYAATMIAMRGLQKLRTHPYAEWVREKGAQTETEMETILETDEVEVTLSGHCDLLRPSGELVDLKTSGTDFAKNHGAQIAASRHLIMATQEREVPKAKIVHLPLNQKLPVIREKDYSERDLEVAKIHCSQTIRRATEAHISFFEKSEVGAEHPYEKVCGIHASPGGKLCSERYCDAFHTPYCPESNLLS